MTSPRTSDAGRARFERWVRDHHDAVFQSAWRITRSRADADDVVQQVFLRVLETPDGVANHAEPERALRWLAVKTALTFRRGETNRRRREEEQAMARPEVTPGRADDAAAQRELLGAVRTQVAALQEELRVATVLRFQEGLTFAAMAELAGVSEPTMFERVKRALDKLRGALAQTGHAAVAVELEKLLTVAEVATVPPKLCATLLALTPSGAVITAAGAGTASAAASATSTTSWLTAAAVVVALVGGGALAVRVLRSPQSGGTTPAVAASPSPGPMTGAPPASAPALARALAERQAEASSAAPAPSAPIAPPPGSATAVRANELLFTELGLPPDAPWDEALVETGHLRGIAVDDDGHTLPHAQVVAFSSDGAPKAFQWRATQATEDDGSFDLRVAVVSAEPQHYFVDLSHADTLPLRIDERVAPRATTDAGRVVLRRNLADHAGDWTLRLTLVGPHGEPVKGVGVRLFRKFIARPTADEKEAAPPQESYESGNVTDELGEVRLAGTRVGRKSLQIYARFLGFRDTRSDFEIERDGASERRIVLEPGLTLRGRLVAPAGCDRARIDAVAMAGGDPFQGDVASDGSFVVIGLDPGRYRLRVSGDCSPAWIDDVAAGRSDVVVELKRGDDPRDVGIHRAELHGRIVATATGGPVTVDPEAIEALALPAGWKADDPRVFTEFVPNALAPQTAQLLVDDSRPPPPPSSDFHVTGLDAGSYVILVRANGYAPGVSRVVTLKEREIAADLVVPLARSE